jgi:hypothetical protein
MFSFLGFGFGIGLGVAAWSIAPDPVAANREAFALFLAIALLFCWFGGRRNAANAAAVAVAQARADARAHVEAHTASAAAADASVNVYLGGEHAVQRGDSSLAAIEQASWYGDRDEAGEILAQLSERADDDGLGELLGEQDEPEPSLEQDRP